MDALTCPSPPKEPTLWARLARSWAELGPPLRPSPEDLGHYASAIEPSAGRPLRALILGVTPELYRLPWPAKSDVRAADKCATMIETVWPGPADAVILADWTALPLPPASCDIVVCDGGALQLSYPDGHRALVKSLARVVAPGGRVVIRVFIPPARPETPDEVLADLLAARIPNLNQLKLRLAMAMQPDPESGVELARVWDAVDLVAPDYPALADRIGWRTEHLSTLDAYRGCRTRYHFVPAETIADTFCREPGGFTLLRSQTPAYELGERCPTLTFVRE